MPYTRQEDFKRELISEFNLNEDTFRCYTLDSNPQIKVILFGRKEWDKCYIGFLINEHFHVLGLGAFACINEDAKALYVSLTCSFPCDEQKLKVCDYTLFDDDAQANIKSKLNQIFFEQ